LVLLCIPSCIGRKKPRIVELEKIEPAISMPSATIEPPASMAVPPTELPPVLVQEKEHNDQNDQIKILEAKWLDIPLPIDACYDSQQTGEGIDQACCLFVYKTSLSPTTCLDFYRCEMERLGWQQSAFFSFLPRESMVMYSKPGKMAVLQLTIPAHTAQTQVRLYAGVALNTHIRRF
jgi:hypothetical protein